MNDDQVEPSNTVAAEPDYEPPAVFDFGAVFDITYGNTDGGGDQTGQRN